MAYEAVVSEYATDLAGGGMDVFNNGMADFDSVMFYEKQREREQRNESRSNSSRSKSISRSAGIGNGANGNGHHAGFVNGGSVSRSGDGMGSSEGWEVGGVGVKRSVDWEVVESAKVRDVRGSEFEIKEKFWGGGTAVLVFVTRGGIELCGLVYGKIAKLLEQADAKLMIVCPWEPEQAREFLRWFERVVAFPGELVCDPTLRLFHAFGFVKTIVQALMSPKLFAPSNPIRQGFRHAFDVMANRTHATGKLTADVSSYRLGSGAAVVGQTRRRVRVPNLLYLDDETTMSGIGCYLDVMAACGVEGAFIPDIDTAALYARFNNIRMASTKRESKMAKARARAATKQVRNAQ